MASDSGEGDRFPPPITESAPSTPTEQQDDAPGPQGTGGGKSRWTAAEDATLRRVVEELGGRHWRLISSHLPGRSDMQCMSRWTKVLRPGIIKGAWTKEEDLIVIRHVAVFGSRRWALIASKLPGRLGKQGRERWYNQLDPTIRRVPFTAEEDALLLRAHGVYGNKWALIARVLPDRTDNAIKNRWNSAFVRATTGSMPAVAPSPSASSGRTATACGGRTPLGPIAEEPEEDASTSAPSPKRARNKGAPARGRGKGKAGIGGNDREQNRIFEGTPATASRPPMHRGGRASAGQSSTLSTTVQATVTHGALALLGDHTGRGAKPARGARHSAAEGATGGGASTIKSEDMGESRKSLRRDRECSSSTVMARAGGGPSLSAQATTLGVTESTAYVLNAGHQQGLEPADRCEAAERTLVAKVWLSSTQELCGEGFDSLQFAYGSVVHRVLSDLTSKRVIIPLMRRELELAWSERYVSESAQCDLARGLLTPRCSSRLVAHLVVSRRHHHAEAPLTSHAASAQRASAAPTVHADALAPAGTAVAESVTSQSLSDLSEPSSNVSAPTPDHILRPQYVVTPPRPLQMPARSTASGQVQYAALAPCAASSPAAAALWPLHGSPSLASTQPTSGAMQSACATATSPSTVLPAMSSPGGAMQGDHAGTAQGRGHAQSQCVLSPPAVSRRTEVGLNGVHGDDALGGGDPSSANHAAASGVCASSMLALPATALQPATLAVEPCTTRILAPASVPTSSPVPAPGFAAPSQAVPAASTSVDRTQERTDHPDKPCASPSLPAQRDVTCFAMPIVTLCVYAGMGILQACAEGGTDVHDVINGMMSSWYAREVLQLNFQRVMRPRSQTTPRALLPLNATPASKITTEKAPAPAFRALVRLLDTVTRGSLFGTARALMLSALLVCSSRPTNAAEASAAARVVSEALTTSQAMVMPHEISSLDDVTWEAGNARQGHGDVGGEARHVHTLPRARGTGCWTEGLDPVFVLLANAGMCFADVYPPTSMLWERWREQALEEAEASARSAVREAGIELTAVHMGGIAGLGSPPGKMHSSPGPGGRNVEDQHPDSAHSHQGLRAGHDSAQPTTLTSADALGDADAPSGDRAGRDAARTMNTTGWPGQASLGIGHEGSAAWSDSSHKAAGLDSDTQRGEGANLRAAHDSLTGAAHSAKMPGKQLARPLTPRGHADLVAGAGHGALLSTSARSSLADPTMGDVDAILSRAPPEPDDGGCASNGWAGGASLSGHSESPGDLGVYVEEDVVPEQHGACAQAGGHVSGVVASTTVVCQRDGDTDVIRHTAIRSPHGDNAQSVPCSRKRTRPLGDGVGGDESTGDGVCHTLAGASRHCAGELGPGSSGGVQAGAALKTVHGGGTVAGSLEGAVLRADKRARSGGENSDEDDRATTPAASSTTRTPLPPSGVQRLGQHSPHVRTQPTSLFSPARSTHAAMHAPASTVDSLTRLPPHTRVVMWLMRVALAKALWLRAAASVLHERGGGVLRGGGAAVVPGESSTEHEQATSAQAPLLCPGVSVPPFTPRGIVSAAELHGGSSNDARLAAIAVAHMQRHTPLLGVTVPCPVHPHRLPSDPLCLCALVAIKVNGLRGSGVPESLQAPATAALPQSMSRTSKEHHNASAACSAPLPTEDGSVPAVSIAATNTAGRPPLHPRGVRPTPAGLPRLSSPPRLRQDHAPARTTSGLQMETGVVQQGVVLGVLFNHPQEGQSVQQCGARIRSLADVLHKWA